MNDKLNTELKKLVGRVQVARSRFQTLLNDRTWVDEARRYADRSKAEVQKLLEGDVTKVRAFLDREKRELERFQRQIPNEVKKFRRLMHGRRKELEQLVKTLRAGARPSAARPKRKATSARPKVRPVSKRPTAAKGKRAVAKSQAPSVTPQV